MGSSAFGTPSEGVKELIRVLAFDSDGGTVVDQQGELVLPPTMAKQPSEFEAKPKVATITTEWQPGAWEKFAASCGFAYAPPPTVVTDVPILAKLSANDPTELCRTLELPRLGRVDMVAEIRPSRNGKTVVAITAIQRTLFFIAPSK